MAEEERRDGPTGIAISDHARVFRVMHSVMIVAAATSTSRERTRAASLGQKPDRKALSGMEVVARMTDRGQTGLLAAAAAGDEYAFRRIIAEHHDDMRRVALSIARDRVVAEEAMQAAWLIAWKKIGDVREEAKLAS